MQFACIFLIFNIYVCNVRLLARKLNNHTPQRENINKKFNYSYNHNVRRQSINYRGLQYDTVDRIVGGDQASIEDYPFMACLVLKTPFSDRFRGGATIISIRWALTAGHCMEYITDYEISQQSAFVRGNTAYWNQDYFEHLITAKYIHDNFDPETLDFDIALVYVKEPFIGIFEKPINVPNADYEYVDDSNTAVLGWGTTTPNSLDYFFVDELRIVNISLVNFDACKNVDRKPKMNVTDRMVCAGAPGKDSCVYDSGGPLIQNNMLIGIVSWGPPKCADAIEPGIYTRVSTFNDWINSTIQNDSLED